MMTEDMEDKHVLVDDLLKLLKRLHFSDIHIKYHAEYPDPRSINANNGFQYIPALMAQKTGGIIFLKLCRSTN
ncbi:hypothetical protein [Fodinibius salsisoli]|uniref:Uncharacterized protein n=1 Tax=Fodinibius salsisoli TaxID=2820877 RepID=A0ABT3PIS2_9BACT|nr:hypothetical protein [Fodinibius salsisoli]MCW9705843.1 hypothetical protein [Fodinibius salsisoli]